jgi:sugar lactone lactonase YvrE
VFRLDRDLREAVKVMDELRACCQRLDLVAKDDKLYVSENARHRVLACDRDGNVLAKWGARDRTAIEGFGSCCNPMNLCFGSTGELYTAESGLGRIKRYSRDGKFLGLVGYVGVERFNRATRLAASCSNIAVAVSADGSRVYVLDLKNNLIRRLARKEG